MSCLYGRGKSCGVCHGLESAKRMGIAKLQVQMDDLAVVLACTKNDEAYGGMCTHIIHRC